MATNVSQAAITYYELVKQGVAPAEAFKQAFPNGIPTAQDRAKDAANAQQKQALGQIGGTLAGALGTAYLVKNVPGWLSTEAGKTVATETAKQGATGTAALAGETAGGSAAGGGFAGGEAATAPGITNSSLVSGVAVPAAVAGATYLGGKYGLDLLKGNKESWGDADWQGKSGRVIAGMATGGISEIARALMGGKNKDQQGRDSYRSQLKDSGFYDPEYNLQLTDGSKVNMGLDGSVKNYNVDFSQEGIGDIVAMVNPLAQIVSGGDEKKRSDLAGELTNAIKNSADPRAEARALYQKYGLDPSAAQGLLGQIGGEDAAAYQHGVGQVFGDKPMSAPQQGSQLASAMGVRPLPATLNQAPTAQTKPILNPQEIKNVGQFGNALVNALSKVSNPNSPGFKDGRRIQY